MSVLDTILNMQMRSDGGVFVLKHREDHEDEHILVKKVYSVEYVLGTPWVVYASQNERFWLSVNNIKEARMWMV